MIDAINHDLMAFRYADADSYALAGEAFPAPELMYSNTTWGTRGHEWKFVSVGPDGKLYVPLGAPCNVCDEDLPFCKDIMPHVSLPFC